MIFRLYLKVCISLNIRMSVDTTKKVRSQPPAKDVIKKEKKTIQRTPKVNDETIKHASTFPLNKKKEEEIINVDEMFEMSFTSTLKKKKKEKCTHSSIINEAGIDVCVDCGENVNTETFDVEWKYYADSKSSDPSRCQYRKVPDKGIKKELEKIGFSREIIDKADYFYQKVTQGDIKRSNLRKGIEFACVFYDYKALGKPIVAEKLDEMFKVSGDKLGRRKMSKGITYFKTRIPKEELMKIEDEYITAEHFIPDILEKFNVKDEHVKYVLNLYKVLSNKSALMNTSNPQSVSSSLVYYFLEKLNIDITPSQFGKLVGLSEITINRITNEIKDILINEDN